MVEIEDPFKDFADIQSNGRRWYYAGFPNYPRNFSRDTLVSALLSSHIDLLITQLEESSVNQARENNANDGAKPGKIHHEMPGMSQFIEDNPPEKMGLFTTYNACDTNGLYLVNVEQLSLIKPVLFYEFIQRRAEQVEKAAAYILDQTGLETDFLYMEEPPAGADEFRLRVTYWKDSILPNPEGKLEPKYPVFYPQAHFIAARGLLSASHILKDETMADISDKMFRAGIAESFSDDQYLAYSDAEESWHQPSSDELHALAYIPEIYADLLPLGAMAERAKENLATPFGFVCTPEEISAHLSNQYHGFKVWPWEQAPIAYGCQKFGLSTMSKIAQRVTPHIGTGQEIISLKREGKKLLPITGEYNRQQLFSIAARQYFKGESLLAQEAWL